MNNQKKINLVFGIHCHQPVGNFGSTIEEAYNKSYLPFVEVLSKHPDIKMVIHYTGSLLEWIESNKPEFMAMLRSLVERGQVEIMTGGFYEPILPIIPHEDRLGQIKMLTDFIKKNFGYDPQGMWLAERVWEPHLARSLNEAGIKYVTLDDLHFKSVGMKSEEMAGYFVTEEEGYQVSIFPIDKKMRYLTPFRPQQEAIEYLGARMNDGENSLIVIVDDGEKFGSWPDTYDWVYSQGWLEGFFKSLEDNSAWIKTTTFAEFTKNNPPLENIYLPTCSYFEMGEWSLPAEAMLEFQGLIQKLENEDQLERYEVFLRGGFWRNFLAKYPESNLMHKKMLYVSKKVDRLRNLMTASVKNPEKISNAQVDLWKGQCNDSYWHGVFGGLYLPHLRHAVYTHLLKAESEADAKQHNNKSWLDVDEIDFDCDTQNEILLSNRKLNVYISPARGGGIFELDFKPKNFNLLNTLTRRKESYHKKILETQCGNQSQDEHASIHELAKEVSEDMKNKLTYDFYLRSMLIDHFLGHDTRLEDFSRCQYWEAGNFVEKPFESRIEKHENKIIVNLARRGYVESQDGSIPLEILKSVEFPKEGSDFRINYNLRNTHSETARLWFGVEFNFSMLGGNDPKRYYSVPNTNLENNKMASLGAVEDIESISIINEWDGMTVTLQIDKPASVWRFPVETVSQSESGYELTYQSSVLLPNWKIQVDPGKAWNCTFVLALDT